MKKFFKKTVEKYKKNKFLKNEKGQGMVEYILLLVVVVAIVAIFKDKIKSAVDSKVSDLGQKINDFKGD